jgi:NADPH-dependent glutamate synthase beta subunit-like oxidoreductase
VKGVRTQKMQLVEEDEPGRRGVRPVPGSDAFLACEAVIVAVGQALDLVGLEKLGIAVNPGGTLRADPLTWQTTRPGVFAGGDAMRGGSYVVQAVADGTQAALAMDRYLAEEGAR